MGRPNMPKHDKPHGHSPEVDPAALKAGHEVGDVSMAPLVRFGIGLPALISAKRASKEKACRASITQIETALGSYEPKWGDYPPSAPMTKGANDINTGAENLVWCLFHTKKGGPYLDMASWEEKLINTDADDAGKKPDDSVYSLTELKELGDEFHNPFIYFHHNDYAKPDKYMKYMIAGQEAECRPQKSTKSGNYHAPSTFMIWSAGSDNKNDNGGEDDVAPWR